MPSAISAPRYHWKRRAAQLGTLLLFVLVPALGLFRVDLVAGSFVVLGRQVGWSDISLLLGFGVTLTMLFVLTYSTTGTVWCGWACPQNAVSEWANELTHKLLGKRADVNVESRHAQVAAAKNTVWNWAVLILGFLAVSMVLGVIPFFYFFTPQDVWSFFTFGTDSSLSHFVHRLYFVSVAAFFLDISGVRYFWCNYACAYRFGQRFFKPQDALHVAYDASRSADCAKCNYCATACIVDLDPTDFKPADTCINCGECIDACNRLHAKEGTIGLLRFRPAEKSASGKGGMFVRVNVWVWLLLLLGIGALGWGIATYSPYDLVAYRAEQSSGLTVTAYRVQVTNKLYAPARMTLSIKGLPEGSYALDRQTLDLDPATRRSVILHVSPDLPKGLHLISVRAEAQDGWTGTFQIEHYSARN